MDYPKSVPGVGLVGGKFADEDAATGRQGSLIPMQWGNQLTDELLSVIRAAGIDPSEGASDQLLKAIRSLVPERSAFARVTGTLSLPASAFGIYALGDGGAAATVTLPSVVDLVSDTELLLFANHANTAAVQVKAAAEQAIQGPAALMAGSTTAFMLSVGGDWVRLRSEKDQGRWVVVALWTATRIAALENTHGQPTLTANAVLTGIDNKLVLQSVSTKLKLSKGDVVQVVAGAYDKLHTVESISGDNELVLNYEHCGGRGNGPLKLPDYAGVITVKRIAKWFNAPLGLGQDWVTLTALRAAGVLSVNSTGRQIQVHFFGGRGAGAPATVFSVNDEVFGMFAGSESDEVSIDPVLASGSSWSYVNVPQSVFVVKELR